MPPLQCLAIIRNAASRKRCNAFPIVVRSVYGGQTQCEQYYEQSRHRAFLFIAGCSFGFLCEDKSYYKIGGYLPLFRDIQQFRKDRLTASRLGIYSDLSI